jgi:hypothetical protein
MRSDCSRCLAIDVTDFGFKRRVTIYIVACKGFAWLIIMGSGFDDYVYWHFFIITTNCNNSHIYLLLNALWLLTEMPYEEFLPNEFSWTELTSVRTEYRSPSRTVNFPSVCCHGNLFLATCYLATTRSLLFFAAGTCLQSRSSAMDVRSGFQPSCHNILQCPVNSLRFIHSGNLSILFFLWARIAQSI